MNPVLKSLFWAAIIAQILPQSLLAHQPQVIAHRIVAPKITQGVYNPLPSKKGDHAVTVRLLPASSEFTKGQFKVVFALKNGCAGEASSKFKPVLNLREILDDDTVAPIYNTSYTPPIPHWRVCPSSSSVIIKNGKPVLVQLRTDFLGTANGSLWPKLTGKVYDLNSTSNKPSSSVLIDLFYRIDGAQKTFSYGSYDDVFGTGVGEDEFEKMHQAVSYDDVASTMPVNLAAFKNQAPFPGCSVSRFYGKRCGTQNTQRNPG